MSAETPLSILIPWRDRPELEETLRRNLPRYERAEAQVVVVNCGGDGDMAAGIIARAGSGRTRQVDLAAPFNRSFALNLGIHFAASPKVFAMDADIVLEQRTLDDALAALGDRTFVTIHTIRESDPSPPSWSTGLTAPPEIVTVRRNLFTTVEWADGTETTIEDFRLDTMDRSRCAAGLILARKADFEAVGGYRSDLDGWGWEDNDMMIRLIRVAGLERREAGAAIHLTHGDAVRDLKGREKNNSTEANFQRVCGRYIRGELEGTYRADVRAWAARARVR